jgi:hypothetical protein
MHLYPCDAYTVEKSTVLEVSCARAQNPIQGMDACCKMFSRLMTNMCTKYTGNHAARPLANADRGYMYVCMHTIQ